VITTHLPVLQVVIPLLAAPACVLLHGRRRAWLLATAVSWTTFLIAALLLDRVLAGGPVSYALGSWAAPFGIEYRVDAIGGYLLVIVSALSTVVLPFARASVEREVAKDRIYLFYTGWLLCLTGLLGIAITGDVFNLFVFLEISSLSSYLLVSLGRGRRALAAAFQYLVVGTIGATFILIGIGLLYMLTGTLNMADLAARLPPLAGNRTVVVAFAFFTIGVAIKAAVYPLHFWLPSAYTHAPSAVTAFIAGTATKVAVYVLLRIFFTIFGARFSYGTMHLDTILLACALTGIVVASTVALFQPDAKRLLAYSSIAQIGFIVLGIATASVTGVSAGIIHLFNHALIKGALFMAMGCVYYRIGTVRIDAMAGIGRHMPWTMAAFVAAGASLVGVPLTAGFISKWYLVLAALERGWWPVAVVIVVASLLAALYLWRVVDAAYFRAPPDPADAMPAEAPFSMLGPLWLLVAANVYFGIHPALTTGVARRAAASLLGVAP